MAFNQNTSILSSCAIVAPALKGTSMSLKKFNNFKLLLDEYGNEAPNNPIVCLAKVLFLNNISEIYCIAPSINRSPSIEEYCHAFKTLQSTSGFYSIICDSTKEEVINQLVSSIDVNTNNPRIAFAGLPSTASIELIKSISNPRLILAHTPTFLSSLPNFTSNILTAAAFASLVSSINTLPKNLNGSYINGLCIEKNFSEKSLLSNFNGPSNINISSIKYIKTQIVVQKLIPSKAISPSLTPNINYLLILDTIVQSIINLVNNIKKSPSFKFLTCRSLFSQIILILSKQKDQGLISDFLLPKINITSSINISISIKPESLFDNQFIDYTIVI